MTLIVGGGSFSADPRPSSRSEPMIFFFSVHRHHLRPLSLRPRMVHGPTRERLPRSQRSRAGPRARARALESAPPQDLRIFNEPRLHLINFPLPLQCESKSSLSRASPRRSRSRAFRFSSSLLPPRLGRTSTSPALARAEIHSEFSWSHAVAPVLRHSATALDFLDPEEPAIVHRDNFAYP